MTQAKCPPECWFSPWHDHSQAAAGVEPPRWLARKFCAGWAESCPLREPASAQTS
jgi:hypothetical protein